MKKFEIKQMAGTIKAVFIILLFVSTTGNVFSQDPYHFILGEEELAAVDVYDINQSSDGTYWIATNNGVYGYDGYNFTKYEHPSTLSNSFFNLTNDYNGLVHFNNLNGQIFRINKGKMELAHTIPDSLLAPYISFNFLSDNSLVVKSLKCYKVKNDSLELLFTKNTTLSSSSYLNRDNRGNLLIQINAKKLAVISPKGVKNVSIYNLDYKEGQKISYNFIYNDRGLFVNNNGQTLYKVIDTSQNNFQIKKIFNTVDANSRIYINSESLWVANNRFGVKNYKFNASHKLQNQPSKLLFKQHFISTVFEDDRGNTLLGTFGDGIIVVPKTGVENIFESGNLKISKICSNRDGGLYLGGFDGNIYNYNGARLDTIYSNGSKLIEILVYLKEQEMLFFDQKQPLFMHLNSPKLEALEIGSVKDITAINKYNYAIATNVNAGTININTLEFTTLYKGRTYRLAYDSISAIFMIASSKGLVTVDTALNQYFILHNDKPLMVNDLEYANGEILAGTKKYGLIRFVDLIPTPFVDTSNGLLSNSIEQFKVVDDLIYIVSELGFQVFDFAGNLLKTLNISDGLKSTRIRDFEVDSSYLWVLHKHGLQRVRLPDLLASKKQYQSQIKDIQFFVNDVLIENNKNQFSSEKNRVKFVVKAPSLERQQDISYQYRLVGIDKKWNVSGYNQNTIEYKSIPAGNYQFELKLMYKNSVQNARSLKFSIAKPIWQEWWFVLLILSFVSALGYWFYNKRLKQLENEVKRTNELNVSKLTAIQSQMNPHFIFNALNSIQEYIVLNERKQAAKYLGMFADLMRIYLRQGNTKSVSIGEEIEALNLYLELEKMRFEDSLSYSVVVDKDINLELFSIPSLLIQPYVENALKHGLLHMEHGRKLVIRFGYIVESNHIVCEIEDNGIGRKKSREINKMRNPTHKSFASNATKNRLELLNHGSKKVIGEETQDLVDSDGLAKGTKVILNIPVELGN